MRLSQAAAAKKFGVSLKTWQRFEKGVIPRKETLVTFIESGVSINWLLAGEGPMRKRPEALRDAVEEETVQAAALIMTCETYCKAAQKPNAERVKQLYETYLTHARMQADALRDELTNKIND